MRKNGPKLIAVLEHVSKVPLKRNASGAIFQKVFKFRMKTNECTQATPGASELLVIVEVGGKGL